MFHPICTVIDVLKRSGTQLVVASVDGILVQASQGTRFYADKLISECMDDSFDLIVLFCRKGDSRRRLYAFFTSPVLSVVTRPMAGELPGRDLEIIPLPGEPP